MQRMKVTGNSNNSTQVIKLHGNPANPEPEEMRIEFPGGYIYVSRVDRDNQPPSWWAHIGVFHKDHGDRHRTENLDADGDPGPTATITDGRVDCFDRHASETLSLAKALTQPGVDHVAVRIEPA